jgi:XTP/dITP diphosphohydrolase
VKKLLIATTNPAKFQELQTFLSDLPLELISLKQLNIQVQASETGTTFEENALMKARFYFEKSHLPTLADDGGFEIDALHGEPGVKSHRWLDPNREATDEEIIEYTIKRMENVPLEKRGAQLRLVLALVTGEGQEFIIEEKVRGIVTLKPKAHRTPGFPYRAILYLPGLNKYYDENELTSEESKTYNHRRRAAEKMKLVIKKYLIV